MALLHVHYLSRAACRGDSRMHKDQLGLRKIMKNIPAKNPTKRHLVLWKSHTFRDGSGYQNRWIFQKFLKIHPFWFPEVWIPLVWLEIGFPIGLKGDHWSWLFQIQKHISAGMQKLTVDLLCFPESTSKFCCCWKMWVQRKFILHFLRGWGLIAPTCKASGVVYFFLSTKLMLTIETSSWWLASHAQQHLRRVAEPNIIAIIITIVTFVIAMSSNISIINTRHA